MRRYDLSLIEFSHGGSSPSRLDRAAARWAGGQRRIHGADLRALSPEPAYFDITLSVGPLRPLPPPVDGPVSAHERARTENAGHVPAYFFVHLPPFYTSAAVRAAGAAGNSLGGNVCNQNGVVDVVRNYS